MGINVTIEDGQGKLLNAVYDPQGYLWLLIALLRAQAGRENLLRYVDPYGHTVFNQLQIPDFVDDCKSLHRIASTDEERQFAQAVIALLEQARHPHLYIRLVGD